MDVGRRNFLRARPGATALPFRPPWALPEQDFANRCENCGYCIEACPTGLLKFGGGCLPIADFSTGATCDFCARCVEACNTGALSRTADRPWDLVAAFGDGCLAVQNVVCRTCGEACDVGAIAFPPRLGGVARPTLDPDRCTGCGDCLAACPTRSITIARRQAANPETNQ